MLECAGARRRPPALAASPTGTLSHRPPQHPRKRHARALLIIPFPGAATAATRAVRPQAQHPPTAIASHPHQQPRSAPRPKTRFFFESGTHHQRVAARAFGVGGNRPRRSPPNARRPVPSTAPGRSPEAGPSDRAGRAARRTRPPRARDAHRRRAMRVAGGRIRRPLPSVGRSVAIVGAGWAAHADAARRPRVMRDGLTLGMRASWTRP